jgi:hypothetical protein
MIKELVVLILALCGLASGLEIETYSNGVIYLDGQSFALAGYSVAQNGTVILQLEPCDDDGQTFEPEDDWTKDPRLGPGQVPIYKKPGFLVSVCTGQNESDCP